jgi:hypothetical protein
VPYLDALPKAIIGKRTPFDVEQAASSLSDRGFCNVKSCIACLATYADIVLRGAWASQRGIQETDNELCTKCPIFLPMTILLAQNH